MSDGEIERLRALIELRNETDSLVEESLRDRLSLETALDKILPALCAATGARGAFIHTFDEDLVERRTFVWPEDLVIPGLEDVLERTSEKVRSTVAAVEESSLVVAQPLDVAGAWFGTAGLVTEDSHSEAEDDEALTHLQVLLQGFCEEIDNFLQSIRSAREKHHQLMALATSLRAPVFFEGLASGVSLLQGTMDVARLLLVYTTDEPGLPAAAQRVELQAYVDGALEVCTLSGKKPEDSALLEEAIAYLREGDRRVARRLGFPDAGHEEVLTTGGAKDRVVGKVLASSGRGPFNTYDRELLAGFAGSILDRIVDFHKEWRTLARSFRPEHVSRLLATPGYERLLDPHEQTVAMLFADISSFTRLSEQVLVTPSRIFGLVDMWGRGSVEAIWREGGVFDKTIGDCVVALFGPPFYEQDPAERLAAAIRAALAIRAMTEELPGRLEHLSGIGVGCSIGVNLAPAMVGRFGPNENFTAFSSGMNNTARLQHCAVQGEVLVMQEALEQLPPRQFKFGEERSAMVKNVEKPIRFRAVLV